MFLLRAFACPVAVAAILCASPALAQNPTSGQPRNQVTIDASASTPAPQPVAAHLGSNRSPSGHVLSVNSQYLTLDGKPWLPVMGEFHFSRFPESQWEHAILQMKAAGVQVIASYVIWIHHEQVEGVFDWKGQRDLRRFAELCAKHGLYFVPRIGPWAHAEVRNGGLPDWIIQRGHTRQNDPAYLASVQAFYHQIGEQLHGLYWKDGGPILGVQLENEYRGTGPGAGDEHIRTLKKMALAEGMDVPLYTVTGWDGASIPLDTALPVFGGYPDAPWGDSPTALPPPELYLYRFANRAGGNMGAIGGSGQSPASVYRGTPFLTAEIGSGIQDTYFRRPVVSPDDIAAIAPIMLGSGANLLGYYMFHGGINPASETPGITLQESQRTAYPTDVPEMSYDFQAPIGADGQERESFRRLKLVHYFLNDFGDRLAPMSARAPSLLPSDPEDLTTPRVAARSDGSSAFLFFNNYTRGAVMPAYPGFRIALKLAHQTLTIPSEPITLPSGAYGIWPVNQTFDGVHLVYSTAQLFKRVQRGQDAYLFFFTIPDIRTEFLLAPGTPIPDLTGFTATTSPAGTLLRSATGAGEAAIGTTHLILVPQQDAERIWKLDDPHALVLTDSQFSADDTTADLRSDGDPHFRFGLFGAHPDIPAQPDGRSGVFSLFAASVSPVKIGVTVAATHPASPRGPWQSGPAVDWRPHPITLAPADTDFSAAAEWLLTIDGDTYAKDLGDVILRIPYEGDVAHLAQNGALLDDDFWNGIPWSIGLDELPIHVAQALNLSILPLPRPFPMYIQSASQLPSGDAPISHLGHIEAIPQYTLTLPLKPAP